MTDSFTTHKHQCIYGTVAVHITECWPRFFNRLLVSFALLPLCILSMTLPYHPSLSTTRLPKQIQQTLEAHEAFAKRARMLDELKNTADALNRTETAKKQAAAAAKQAAVDAILASQLCEEELKEAGQNAENARQNVQVYEKELLRSIQQQPRRFVSAETDAPEADVVCLSLNARVHACTL